MYIQQWQDLVGPSQHHRGIQQNNLQQNVKQKWTYGCVWTHPSADFRTNTVHPQPVKRNAYMIAE